MFKYSSQFVDFIPGFGPQRSISKSLLLILSISKKCIFLEKL